MLISRKRYKIETYFQRKTNWKSYMAYWMALVLVTLNDLEGHSPVAGLFKCNPSNVWAVFYHISTDSAFVRTLSNSWASCLHQWRTISGKLLAFGFVATMRLLSTYFDLLFFIALTLIIRWLEVHLGSKKPVPFITARIQLDGVNSCSWCHCLPITTCTSCCKSQ